MAQPCLQVANLELQLLALELEVLLLQLQLLRFDEQLLLLERHAVKLPLKHQLLQLFQPAPVAPRSRRTPAAARRAGRALGCQGPRFLKAWPEAQEQLGPWREAPPVRPLIPGMGATSKVTLDTRSTTPTLVAHFPESKHVHQDWRHPSFQRDTEVGCKHCLITSTNKV